MRLNELLNKRADKQLWSMAPCEICDAPTRWCLSPYCQKCEWLIAYWRGGVVNLEDSFGNLPDHRALDGDSVLLDDGVLPWFNSRGFFVDPSNRTRLLLWGEYWPICTGAIKPPAPTRTSNLYFLNERNEMERKSKLEMSIEERD